MLRLFACAALLLMAWPLLASPPQRDAPRGGAPDEEGEAPEPAPALDERNRELLHLHGGIWSLMGLSRNAVDELNGIVVAINTRVHQNRSRFPEEFAEARAVRRSQTPLGYEEYLASHERRFDLLGISKPTQQELLGALEFTWMALHDPAVPEQQREAAIAIREMMKSMGGPPPCCDENLFIRAGMGDR